MFDKLFRRRFPGNAGCASLRRKAAERRDVTSGDAAMFDELLGGVPRKRQTVLDDVPC
jgi:hypothetical protein